MKNDDFMETLAKRLTALTLFGLFIVLMLMTFSCGSRKKQKESKVYMEQVNKREMKNLILRNQKESTEAVNTITEVKKENEQFHFDGKVADIAKPATVEKQEVAGSTKWTYTNFTEVKSTAVKSLEQSRDSLSRVNTEKDSIIAELQHKLEENKKLEKKDESLNVERETGFPWWLWIIIAVIVLVYLVISYYRNTLNPMRWLQKQ